MRGCRTEECVIEGGRGKLRTCFRFRGRLGEGPQPAAFEIPAAVVPGIARICSLGLGMDELLGETCRVIVGLCGVDACYLGSYRERGGGAAVHHFAGSGDWPDLRAVYGPDPRWDAALGNLRDHGILAADDILSLPPDDPVRVLHEPHSVRSLLLAPLKFGTALVGLLSLHGYGARRMARIPAGGDGRPRERDLPPSGGPGKDGRGGPPYCCRGNPLGDDAAPPPEEGRWIRGGGDGLLGRAGGARADPPG